MTICFGSHRRCFTPARRRASGTSLWPQPWKGVYTSLKLSATAGMAAGSMVMAITSLRKASSVSSPMTVIMPLAMASS